MTVKIVLSMIYQMPWSSMRKSMGEEKRMGRWYGNLGKTEKAALKRQKKNKMAKKSRKVNRK
jgi:hypothetical protein